MKAQRQLVWKFIINREIEAPARFQAIQTYRAAMAILRQQQLFVEQLYASGMVDESEKELLLGPIQRQERRLQRRGPHWRAPSISEVRGGAACSAAAGGASSAMLRCLVLPAFSGLCASRTRILGLSSEDWCLGVCLAAEPRVLLQVLRSLPFLSELPQRFFDLVVSKGLLLKYDKDDVIWAPPERQEEEDTVLGGAPCERSGIFIVIAGLISRSFTNADGKTEARCSAQICCLRAA